MYPKQACPFFVTSPRLIYPGIHTLIESYDELVYTILYFHQEYTPLSKLGI